ncbi:MAG: carboxylating nicotinate-nucleotide diphosphorylase [Burkholderiaceae bacterium]|nr:carboxylating nicotinate-nucleotide diphosphorylase [Microbacteriaceae bacterium]
MTAAAVDAVVRDALEEDAPWGDITSELLIPPGVQATARLVARESGVLSGGGVFAAAMLAVDPAIEVHLAAADGTRFAEGEVLATVRGSAHAVLRAERVGLNLVQRLSGIATETARYVSEVVGTSARIVDTRKTTPGLRVLERHAVRCGGGHNHRFSLSDAVLAKDNHLAVLASQGIGVTEALLGLRARLSHTTHLEVEVDRADQIEAVLAGGVDTIMLDNFTLAELREGVAQVAGRAMIEASGNVSLATVRAIALTGVDIISVGALTHSVRSLDLGLDVDIDVPADVS